MVVKDTLWITWLEPLFAGYWSGSVHTLIAYNLQTELLSDPVVLTGKYGGYGHRMCDCPLVSFNGRVWVLWAEGYNKGVKTGRYGAPAGLEELKAWIHSE